MGIKKIFSPINNMNARQLQAFIDSNREGDFTLLDVRQPTEYENARIPGSKLIPLPALNDRLSELDPQKPVIAYWAAGRRSRAAAQILTGSGFEPVYNLKGGIAAWQGHAAAGPSDMGMMLLTGEETPREVICLAYGLEEGLRKFYSASIQLAIAPQVVGILTKLAAIEVNHKQRLMNLYRTIDPTAATEKAFENEINSELMEGGFNPDKLLENNRPAFKTTAGALEFAMMLEAQAMDLYMRYADIREDPEVKNILFNMAQEEKAHLKSLANFMDKNVDSKGLDWLPIRAWRRDKRLLWVPFRKSPI